MTNATEFTLAELVICAAAEAWRGGGEVLATGIGPLPRIAAGLAKLTFAPEILMTDGEAWLVEEVDRWGQGNIAALGDLRKPKVQLLGVRGFPGNSISHRNSMFLPSHTKRTFIEGEVDVVASVGFADKRWPEGVKKLPVDIGIVVTNLCVMDFNGPDHAARVVSLHPGVSFEEVQGETGFPLVRAETVATTPAPTGEQFAIIRRLDPTGIRATVIKGNPPGTRQAA